MTISRLIHFQVSRLRENQGLNRAQIARTINEILPQQYKINKYVVKLKKFLKELLKFKH